MEEIEKTFLVRSLPDLSGLEGTLVRDKYFPEIEGHPSLRIRQQADKFEMTKKVMVDNDPSRQREYSIHLSQDEFNCLIQAPGRSLCKVRYRFPVGKYIAEIDVFKEDLEGLVLADFEFKNVTERDQFQPPEFCEVDVTGIEILVGGMLCGRSYNEIRSFLLG